MPIVTIQVTREGTSPGADRTTADQKARLFKGVSELMQEVLGKPPDDTWIIFQEVDLEDWGRSGVSVPAYRRNRPSSA